MAGFCRAKYKPIGTPSPGTPKDDEHHYMLSTQFEACDARKAFPCFDEPNLKATFDFEVEVPEDLVALSNMPVKSTREGSKSGLKFVSFERTPIMSTYVSGPPLMAIPEYNLTDIGSSLLGPSAISSTLKRTPNASTMVLQFQFVSTQLEASRNRLALPLSVRTRLWTISQRSSISTTLCPSLICLPFTSL